MKIIIEHQPGESHILELSAALAALEEYGKPEGSVPVNVIQFENGEMYYVRWNKSSVSVTKALQ